MRKVLIGVGGLVTVLVAAALIVPSFINWNDFNVGALYILSVRRLKSRLKVENLADFCLGLLSFPWLSFT